MQFKINIMCGFHKSLERTFGARQATVVWLMLMLVLSVLQAWTNDAWAILRNLTLEAACRCLPMELPPALAGKTEPSPSSWEVWSPSTSYSRAGNAPSLEEQKRSTCGWRYMLVLPLRKRLWFYHIPSCSQEGRKEESWVHKWVRFSCSTHRALFYGFTPTTTTTHMLLMSTVSKDFEDGIFASSGPAMVRAWDLKDRTSTHKGLTV